MVLTYTWKQVLGKEAQVRMGGQREKGGGQERGHRCGFVSLGEVC